MVHYKMEGDGDLAERLHKELEAVVFWQSLREVFRDEALVATEPPTLPMTLMDPKGHSLLVDACTGELEARGYGCTLEGPHSRKAWWECVIVGNYFRDGGLRPWCTLGDALWVGIRETLKPAPETVARRGGASW